MIEAIERTYIRQNIPPYDRMIDVKTLLGGNTEHDSDTTKDIIKTVCSFIEATHRSV